VLNDLAAHGLTGALLNLAQVPLDQINWCQYLSNAEEPPPEVVTLGLEPTLRRPTIGVQPRCSFRPTFFQELANDVEKHQRVRVAAPIDGFRPSSETRE
jgi:hypothetical protein